MPACGIWSQFGAARSIVSIEDPIEVAVEGVAQSQVNPTPDWTWRPVCDSSCGRSGSHHGRRNPRSANCGSRLAGLADRASAPEHLHAGSAAEGISRLWPTWASSPTFSRSGVLGILSQRLARRLCDCARPAASRDELLGLPVSAARLPRGCEACGRTGYRGRIVLAELLTVEKTELGRAILSRMDSAALEALAVKAKMITRWQRAYEALQQGRTSPAEVRRVLGLGAPAA